MAIRTPEQCRPHTRSHTHRTVQTRIGQDGVDVEDDSFQRGHVSAYAPGAVPPEGHASEYAAVKGRPYPVWGDGRWMPYRERMGPVQVVLVDDHEMVIEGLKRCLRPRRPPPEVVGIRWAPNRPLAIILDLQPDIVLCDVRMQGRQRTGPLPKSIERDPDAR